MDEPTRKALEGIAAAEAESEPQPSGPIVLSREYLDAIERVEQLPANRRGADKTWTERALDSWQDAVARARRIPRA